MPKNDSHQYSYKDNILKNHLHHILLHWTGVTWQKKGGREGGNGKAYVADFTSFNRARKHTVYRRAIFRVPKHPTIKIGDQLGSLGVHLSTLHWIYFPE